MAMAAHNDDGTNTSLRHDDLRAPGTTDVVLTHPWALGLSAPALARRGSRWA
jgi:hypothetical protein